MNQKTHFETIYNEFRTLVMNQEYYAVRISKARQRLLWIDIFLALFASGSGVLGFAFWKSELLGFQAGPILLSLATGIAVVIAIARPYLKLEDELERLSSIQGAYGSIAFAMKEVVDKIKIEEAISPNDEAVFKALSLVRSTMITKEDSPTDRVLIDKSMDIVNERYPYDSYFYYPKSTNGKAN